MSNIGKKDIISREIDQAEKEARLEMYKTAMKKVQFVNEIKNGLGAEMKKNPNQIRFIKKSWFKRIILSLQRLFTKF